MNNEKNNSLLGTYELQEFFGDVVPRYVIEATPKELTILANDSQHIIDQDDVEQYFTHGHGQSGLRSFAGISGDWRMIDELAEMCRNYFEEFGFVKIKQ